MSLSYAIVAATCFGLLCLYIQAVHYRQEQSKHAFGALKLSISFFSLVTVFSLYPHVPESLGIILLCALTYAYVLCNLDFVVACCKYVPLHQVTFIKRYCAAVLLGLAAVLWVYPHLTLSGILLALCAFTCGLLMVCMKREYRHGSHFILLYLYSLLFFYFGAFFTLEVNPAYLLAVLYGAFFFTFLALAYLQLEFNQRTADYVKNLENQLSATRQLLLQSDSLNFLARIASGMSHDLGTPVFLADTLVSRLEKNSPADETSVKRARRLRDNLVAMREKVNTVLSPKNREKLPHPSMLSAIKESARFLEHENSTVNIKIDVPSAWICHIPQKILLHCLFNIWSFTLHHANQSKQPQIIIRCNDRVAAKMIITWEYSFNVPHDVHTLGPNQDTDSISTGLLVAKEILGSHGIVMQLAAPGQILLDA
ncbi:MAG: hypothetical protein C9356_15755 [Oleiphilus sp.]|nr:MAG: hypothetical protein C9356_15755 [Oleiphilus sp.]